MKIKRFLLLLLCLSVLMSIFPAGATAAGVMDGETADFTISFAHEGTPIKNAAFYLYRVADVDKYGAANLTEKFENSAVELASHDAAHWQNVTEVLESYVQLRKIESDYSGKTNQSGEAEFTVKRGIYLVKGDKKSQGGRTYTPYAFLISLPTIDAVENKWVYDVKVSPKYTSKTDGGGGSDDYVSLKVMKTWDDTGYEHNRPSGVSVVLLRDGEAYSTVKLSKENSWKHEWSRLNDKYVWTIAEEEVPEGYTVSMTKSGTTYVITNKYDGDKKGGTVSRSVVKIWDDAGYEKQRPDSVTVVLKKDGEKAEEVTLSGKNGWKYEWNGLNADYDWTIEETDVPENYSVKVKKDGTAYVLTNTYKEEDSTQPATEPDEEKTTVPREENTTEPDEEKTTVPREEKTTEPDEEKTTEPDKEKPTKPDGENDREDTEEKVNVSVHKIWEDNGSEDRPKEIEAEILRDGVSYGTVKLNAENNWKHEWNGIDGGNWVVREVNVPEGYVSSVIESAGTFVIKNTLIPEDKDVKVMKVWKDENHEEERPKKVEAELLGNGVVYDTVVLNEENGWQYEWTGLDGAIEWTVREKTVLDKYKSNVVIDRGVFVIINTYTVIPQTGQLWWPVPVLVSVGLMMLCFGLLRRRGAK